MQQAKVRVHPYKPHATNRTIITGYIVYAWIGHPLLGQVHGTERIFKKESEAKKYATGLRKMLKGGK